VFIVSVDNMGDECVRQHRAAIDAPIAADARRILYTSHMGAGPASRFQLDSTITTIAALAISSSLHGGPGLIKWLGARRPSSLPATPDSDSGPEDMMTAAPGPSLLEQAPEPAEIGALVTGRPASGTTRCLTRSVHLVTEKGQSLRIARCQFLGQPYRQRRRLVHRRNRRPLDQPPQLME
jgi:hypothetical protein